MICAKHMLIAKMRLNGRGEHYADVSTWMVQDGEAYVSDTDKTKPYWVKLYQNPELRRTRHDHRKGECDIDKYFEEYKQNTHWTRRGECGYWVSFYRDHSGFYAKNSHGEKGYRAEANGADRTNLRIAIRDMLKTSREDLEDNEFQSFPHRHGVQWDMW